MQTAPLSNLADLIDLERYPIADPAAPDAVAFAARCRERYLRSGLCELPAFVRPDALTALAAEAAAAAAAAYFCRGSHNAYLSADDDALPPDDAARRREHTYVGSVPYDRIGERALLRRLYLWDPLKDFIGAVLGKAPFYRFADPFGACSINVFVDGGEHGWHFDESEYTVTLMLQPPDAGGAFEYVPQIRGLSDEKRIVARVLDGDRERVAELPFRAGTLLIFGGRQTLHRVTRVRGARPRLVPVLCYAERPGLRNSAEVRELFWGRRGPAQATA